MRNHMENHIECWFTLVKKFGYLSPKQLNQLQKSWGIARTSSISTHWFRIKKNQPTLTATHVVQWTQSETLWQMILMSCKPHVVLSSSLGYLFEIHFCCRRKWFQCLAFSLKLPFLIGSVYGILNLHLPYQSTTWILWVLLVVVLKPLVV